MEGRQAVRELLLANRRDTREIWMAADLDAAPVLEDIRELAAEARVVVKEVGRGKLEASALAYLEVVNRFERRRILMARSEAA